MNKQAVKIYSVALASGPLFPEIVAVGEGLIIWDILEELWPDQEVCKVERLKTATLVLKETRPYLKEQSDA